MRTTATVAMLSAVASLCGQDVGAGRDMLTILGRYRDLLQERAPEPATTLRAWLDALGADGRFVDVDYADDTPSGWEPATHLARVAAWARGFHARGHALCRDPDTRRAIDRGLDAWLAARPRSSNWWWNEIGVPRAMREIVALHGDELTAARRAGAVDVIAQARQRGVGANLLWSAELSLHLGCLRSDATLVERAAAAIAREIDVTDGDGIQADMSFHQHGPRLQQLHYGGAYLATATEILWQLADTQWELSGEKAALLSSLLLDGHQWFVRSAGTTPCGLDRAVARRGALHGMDLTRVARLLREVTPERAGELAALEARQRGAADAAPLVGFRVFPRSDHAVFAREGFLFAIKGVSVRTRPTERINRENLRGFHLGFGDHYLLRRGDEYLDLMPVWNWDRLPGATIAPAVRAGASRSAFVGGLAHETDGVFVCELVRGADAHELRARRAWFCAGDTIACVGAGIHSTDPVVTTLEQCRLRGPVRAGFADGTDRELRRGTHLLRAVTWLHHDDVAFVFHAPLDLNVRNAAQTGTWRSVSDRYDDREVTADVFSAWIEHDAGADGTVSWIVAPGASVDTGRAWSADPPVRVLARGPDVLAVTHAPSGLLQAAFFAPGAVRLDDGSELAVDRPCLLAAVDDRLWVADPTHTGGTVTVTTARGVRRLELAADGSTRQ